MTVADYVVRYLARRGVTHVFEVAGGMICPLLDAAARYEATRRGPSLRLVSMVHEQATGFAAEGFARMKRGKGPKGSDVPGVAFATSGPGATNLLTAIGSCYFDSTPAIFITGQVNSNEQKKSLWDPNSTEWIAAPGPRQLGFQETDIIAVAGPLTKGAWDVSATDAIDCILEAAFDCALSGRQGPVLLDIPFDVQRAKAKVSGVRIAPARQRRVSTENLLHPLKVLPAAARPLVLVGGGARGPSVVPFLEKLGVPVVHSLLGSDVLPTAHRLNAGMIGTYGNRYANRAIMKSDALLVLGSRMDIRQTGAQVKKFEKRSIFHVDVDPCETRVRAERINMTVEDFCKRALSAVRRVDCKPWRNAIESMIAWYPPVEEQHVPAGTIHPNEFLAALGRVMSHAAAFVVDVGQHQMWAAQSLVRDFGQRFLTSGGMGAMGAALPMAIGACYAGKRDGALQPVVCIAGDGGFQVNLNELRVVAREKLPVKMVVLNNEGHGMVRQFQHEVFGGRVVSTGLGAPDFDAIARAYGIPAWQIFAPGHVAEALGWLWTGSGPKLLEVAIDPRVQALPKTRFGRPLDDMEGAGRGPAVAVVHSIPR